MKLNSFILALILSIGFVSTGFAGTGNKSCPYTSKIGLLDKSTPKTTHKTKGTSKTLSARR